MTDNDSGMRETRLSLAVRKAFRKLLKNIKSEPTLIIEADGSESNVSEETVTDILAWLFKGR